MDDSSKRRRGGCPSVWAPMQSGDGLIVRVRPRLGRLVAARVRGLAAASMRFGNGIIELTRRANLQLRGVSSSALADLQTELTRLKLAEPQRADEREELSLLVCPLSGLAARCPPLESLASQLAQVLSSFPVRRGPAEKFLVTVSGGSDLFARVHADIHVVLHEQHPGGAEVRLAAGEPGSPAASLGTCRVEDAARAVQALLVMASEPAGELRRVRDLVRSRGLGSVRAAVEPLAFEHDGLPAAWPASCLGFHSGPRSWLGFALPFGSATAEDWQLIADIAERFGSGELRLTPTRAVLLPDVREAARGHLTELLTQRGLSVVERAPALQLVACSGAPSCRSAHGETRRLASMLGEIASQGVRRNATLHVSGCEKSCAWGGAADITLVHGPDGCRLAFELDVAAAARTAVLSVAAIRERLTEWSRGART